MALVGWRDVGEHRGLRHRPGEECRGAWAARRPVDRRDACEHSVPVGGGTGLLRGAGRSRHLLLRLPCAVRRLRSAAVVGPIAYISSVARMASRKPGRQPMHRRVRRGATGAALLSVGAIAWYGAALAQQSVGRGAPDPLGPPDIVGSEGKGYWTGAGVPP